MDAEVNHRRECDFLKPPDNRQGRNEPMKTETKQLSHLDYADAAEAAERGRSWPQAAILWRRAMDTLTSTTTPSRKSMRHASRYIDRLEACEAKAIART